MYADLPVSKKLQMRNGKPRQVLEKKKTMKQKRLNGIDAAKGLAIMMVVLGHCADKNGPDRVLLHFSMFTGVWCVLPSFRCNLLLEGWNVSVV